MRLKSYFAPTVQNAIALARREFGDEITLVTSHVAPANARHLGEYEVIFDIEEQVTPALAQKAAPLPAAATTAPAAPAAKTSTVETEEKEVAVAMTAALPIVATESSSAATAASSAVPPFSAFQETLLEAVTPKPGAEEEKAQKLRQIRFTLIELGVEAGLTRAIMGMLEGSIGKRNTRPVAEPAAVVAESLAACAPQATATRAETFAFEIATSPVSVPAIAAQITAPSLAVAVKPEKPSTPSPVLEVEPRLFEMSEQEQAATQSGKVVVISKRRETQTSMAASAAAPSSSLAAFALGTTSAAAATAVAAAGGVTAAELAFISSLSGASAEPLERRAVGR